MAHMIMDTQIREDKDFTNLPREKIEPIADGGLSDHWIASAHYEFNRWRRIARIL